MIQTFTSIIMNIKQQNNYKLQNISKLIKTQQIFAAKMKIQFNLKLLTLNAHWLKGKRKIFLDSNQPSFNNLNICKTLAKICRSWANWSLLFWKILMIYMIYRMKTSI